MKNVIAVLPCLCAEDFKRASLDVKMYHVRQKMNLVKRVNVTDIFSYKPRLRAPSVTSIRHNDNICQRHLRNHTVTAISAYFIALGNQGRAIIRNITRNQLKDRRIPLRRPYRITVLRQPDTRCKWSHRMERRRCIRTFISYPKHQMNVLYLL